MCVLDNTAKALEQEKKQGQVGTVGSRQRAAGVAWSILRQAPRDYARDRQDR